MKIVNKKEFLQLPEGTLYMYYIPFGDSEGLRIKMSDGDYWGVDWVYVDLLTLTSPEDNGSSDFDDRFHKDLYHEFKQDLDDTYRDGLFEDDEQFVIYDKEDIKRLIEKLNSLIK